MSGAVAGLFIVASVPLVLTTARIIYLAREKATTSPAESTAGSLAAAKAAGARVAFTVRFGAISVGWFLLCVGASAWVLSYVCAAF